MPEPVVVPALDAKTHTIAQFVADFFSNRAAKIDYSEHLDDQCWNGYVGLVAEAGAILEDVVQARIRIGQQIAAWYDILEASTEVFRDHLLRARGRPRLESLAAAFGIIVDNHLEHDADDARCGQCGGWLITMVELPTHRRCINNACGLYGAPVLA